MFVVDTDVMIDVQRGHPPALAWFAALTELPMIPGIVVMELIQDARNAKEIQQALKLTAPLKVVWPTEADCALALAHFTAYHLSHGLGLLDSLIGASAIGLGASLQTFNSKHYQVIPGLVLDQPYVR
jgi:predicted nucleic acid-binding protein